MSRLSTSISLLLLLVAPSFGARAQQDILFVTDRDGNQEIYTMHGSGDAQKNLTFNKGPDMWPRPSPTGGGILFLRVVNGVSQVHWMKLNGDAQVNLSQSKFMDEEPEWSPDGKFIAFVRWTKAGKTIWTMKANGGAQKQLTYAKHGKDGRPQWAPKGDWILFERMTAKGTQLWKMRANGDAATQLTYGEFNRCKEGQWSPDGEWIVYARSGQKMGLWKMRKNGDAATQLTYPNKPGGGTDGEPRWSADGQWIVFSRKLVTPNSLDGNFEICRMRANGSAQENLTLNKGRDEHPSWSTDGKHILFVTDRDGHKEVYTINANGDAPRPLTYNNGTDTDPVFVPKSRRPEPHPPKPPKGTICFTSSGGPGQTTKSPGLFCVFPDGTGLRGLKGSYRAQFPRISPDGKWVVCSFVHRKGPCRVFAVDGSSSYDVRGTERHWNPEWTADGKRLFFSTHPPEDFNTKLIAWINVDGSGYGKANLNCTHFTPAPDGLRVVFVRNGFSVPNGLYQRGGISVAKLGTENARQSITPNDPHWGTYALCWSPDSSKIAFMRSKAGAGCEVCIVPSTGGRTRVIARVKKLGLEIAFSPDGKTLLLIEVTVKPAVVEMRGERVHTISSTSRMIFVDVATGAITPFNVPIKNVHHIDWR